MAYVYSRNSAESRHEYAEHPHCYVYVYPPTGGWPGHPVPGLLVDHGGGWVQDDYDRSNERYPDRNRLGRTDIADQFRDGGGAVILVEYPLGSGLTVTSEMGPNATHFPETWILRGRLNQWLKDQCAPYGRFYNKLDPASLVLWGSSAGSLTPLMSQWVPDAWGVFPRTPGKQLSLGPGQYRSSQLLRALILTAPPLSLAQMDPTRNLGGSLGYSPVIRALVNPWRYLGVGGDPYGWRALPQGHREAMSAFLMLEQMSASDLAIARSIPLWVATNGNPSVQVDLGDSLTDEVSHYYGADDAADVYHLEQRLNIKGGFNFRTYWGDDAATTATYGTAQAITAAAGTPIILTTAIEHGVKTGNTVKVGQALGNTAANGVRTATRIDSTHFSLDGSVSNGVYAGGGVWCFNNPNGNYSVGTDWPALIADWLRNVVLLDLA
jgi:hypothetical protein